MQKSCGFMYLGLAAALAAWYNLSKLGTDDEAKLNELGADGWELIQRVDGLFSSKEKANCLKNDS